MVRIYLMPTIPKELVQDFSTLSLEEREAAMRQAVQDRKRHG